jgi:ATP-dependent DNA helicase RecQ
VLRVLEVLEERGMVERRVADVRLPYVRRVSAEALTAASVRLVDRFEAKERAEVARIDAVVALLTGETCLAAGIAAHFGDTSVDRCGCCSACTGDVAPLPDPPSLEDPDPSVLDAVAALAVRHPDALGEARQRARFLCGISSPAATRAKLPGHPLFGSWSDRDFRTVLDACAFRMGGAPGFVGID